VVVFVSVDDLVLALALDEPPPAVEPPPPDVAPLPSFDEGEDDGVEEDVDVVPEVVGWSSADMVPS